MLKILILHSNSFSGTIPSSIFRDGNLLEGFYVYENSFKGTLPCTLCAMKYIRDIDVSDNFFTSSIPSCISNLSTLKYFDLSINCFSGTIPSDIGRMKSLEKVVLAKNRFDGKLPDTLFQLSSLEVLIFSHNKLSGSLDALAHLSSLSVLSGYFNQMRGVIPPELFLNNYNLSFLDLSQNCFHGALPEEICAGANIRTLSLNSLSKSSGCSAKLYDPFGVFEASLAKRFEGNIPDCVWSMKNLEVLLLAGNLFTGSLSDVRLSKDSRLRELVLSSNFLGGEISSDLLSHDFDVLDLSWNRIGGKLNAIDDAQFCTASGESRVNKSYHFEVNRLSGLVPKCLEHVQEVSIMVGNMLNCNPAHNIPENDENRGSVQCGSTNFNISILVYASSFILMIGFVLWSHQENINNIYFEICSFFKSRSNWIALKDYSNVGPGTKNFGSTIHGILRICITMSIIVTLFGLILFSSMSQNASAYAERYTWETSLALLSGQPIAIATLCMWITILIICQYMSFDQVYRWTKVVKACKELALEMRQASSTEENLEKSDLEKFHNEDFSALKLLTYNNYTAKEEEIEWSLRVVMKSLIVLMLDVALVFVCNILYVVSQMSYISTSAKLGIQIGFSVFSIVWGVVCIGVLVDMVNASYRLQLFLKIFLKILNCIMIPVISIILSSKKCMGGLFTGVGEIQTDVGLYECASYKFVDDVIICNDFEYNTYHLVMERPFVYNGGCASVVFAYYVPVYIFSYVLDMVLVPILYYILSTFMTQKEYLLFGHKMPVPHMIWPRHADISASKPSYLAKGDMLFTHMFSHLALLLTFGIACPLLAVIIGFGALQDAVSYVYVLRNYLNYMIANGDGGRSFEVSSRLIPRNLLNAYLLVMWTSAVFYSFVLLDVATSDMLGTAKLAYLWIPVVIFFFTLTCHLVFHFNDSLVFPFTIVPKYVDRIRSMLLFK